MPVQARTRAMKFDAAKYQGLDRDTLVRLYRTMYLSRRIDDREIQLKRQNKIFFQISGAGHEGILVAAGLVLKPGYDWFYAYYRDRALCLMLGMTPYDGEFPRALEQAQKAPLGRAVRHAADEVTYVSGGDGTTSQGEFFEALNTACVKKLPVLFMVEDNGYAISVPVEVQTPGGSVSKLVASYPGLHIEECDGTDPLASYAVCKRAVEHCRARKGPALVHAHVIRPYSHSLSDDEKLYKPAAERDAEARRDPIPKFGLFLVREGILDEKELEGLEAEVDREVLEAADRALAAELP